MFWAKRKEKDEKVTSTHSNRNYHFDNEWQQVGDDDKNFFMLRGYEVKNLDYNPNVKEEEKEEVEEILPLEEREEAEVIEKPKKKTKKK